MHAWLCSPDGTLHWDNAGCHLANLNTWVKDPAKVITLTDESQAIGLAGRTSVRPFSRAEWDHDVDEATKILEDCNWLQAP
ncbi:hypothetical protein HNP46_006099 [Pseudomonas nitritireducens]|uniref:Uncharacterized protein n=1 Tax=Pseudomonas nitroreducens TaxID=46680 RepID=A0A7W7P3N7_PSENT|nr:hypothetical protein [Pseudomonas nitritireducens]MBB4867188.1 hypothetical protein [Pseudomonas nitritireducens]